MCCCSLVEVGGGGRRSCKWMGLIYGVFSSLTCHGNPRGIHEVWIVIRQQVFPYVSLLEDIARRAVVLWRTFPTGQLTNYHLLSVGAHRSGLYSVVLTISESATRTAGTDRHPEGWLTIVRWGVTPWDYYKNYKCRPCEALVCMTGVSCNGIA